MKKYLLKIKKLIILIFIAYGVLSLINIFSPIINAKLLTSLTNFNLNEAYKYTFIFFVISILSVLINKLAIKLLGKIHEKLLYDIRYDIIQRLFKLKMKNFDEIPSVVYLTCVYLYFFFSPGIFTKRSCLMSLETVA